MDSHLISVIVPFYNAEKYLKDSIKSLIHQTYSNIEIILVNDGSTDKSLQICEKYAAKDFRIKIINKKINEGVDLARYSGLEEAKGDYICFLDADDWFKYDAIEYLHHIAKREDVDITFGQFTRILSRRVRIKRINPTDPHYVGRPIRGKEKDELFVSFCGVNKICTPIVSSLFKKELFSSSLKPTRYRFGEDIAMVMQLYLKAQSIYVARERVMFYRWGGVTSKYQPDFLKNCKSIFPMKIEGINLIGHPEFLETILIELVNCLASEVMQIATFFPKERNNNIARVKKEMQDPIYGEFTKISNHKYFKVGEINTFCVNLDAEGAYSAAEKRVKKTKNRIMRCAKKLFFLFNKM